MDAENRRQRLSKILKNSTGPVTGTSLAKELGVSRQVIVQDVALLRAAGEQVLATPQGYVLVATFGQIKVREKIACHHTGSQQLEEELSIIVKAGGTVVDVIVEHPVYGELKGMLMLKTNKDIEDFLESIKQSDAKPLSALTDGVHLHTVEAESDAIIKDIKNALKKKGILLEQ
ncbi:hypothetical protein GGQ84_000285 [Desulfitispora alkaliphila]|uniref:transcription repressor NadR n=1 Tax=Desulfitispora alkaliphila TaxID=622674 RepID=UPI003D208223